VAEHAIGGSVAVGIAVAHRRRRGAGPETDAAAGTTTARSKVVTWFSYLFLGITKIWCTTVTLDMRYSTSYINPGHKMW
jgi:hypothetical protein